MAGYRFEFYATLKRETVLKDLTIRCDYRDEIEFGGTFNANEMKIDEEGFLMIQGEFGEIDLGLPLPELKEIIEKEVRKQCMNLDIQKRITGKKKIYRTGRMIT